jgi:hypothetical protein
MRLTRWIAASACLVALAGGAAADTVHDKTGYVTIEKDGRLWVFRDGSLPLAEYRKLGEVEKHVTRVGAGPEGMTVKAPDSETILSYLLARDGFQTAVVGDRAWVFREGSPEVARFVDALSLSSKVERPGAGPMGTTLVAPDQSTMDAYLRASQ